MPDKEYQDKKRECWDALYNELLKGEVQWQPVSRKEIVNFVFDRAYALGKLQASCGQVKEAISQEDVEKASVEYADKTAKQYEVCNSEFVQEIMVAFEQGANFALGKQEKDADTVIVDKEEYDELCKRSRYIANWVPSFRVCPICGEYNPSGCICANCDNNKDWNK